MKDLPVTGTTEMVNMAVLMSLELSGLQHLDSRDNDLNASQLELIGKETGYRLLNGERRGGRERERGGEGDNQSSSGCQAPNQEFKASFFYRINGA